jgi:hypothetical protein
MSPYHLLFTFVVAIAFAYACWLVFWTQSAVRFAQSRPGKRQRPIAFESWYPAWVRFEGIWLLLMIAFILSFKLAS